jgi:SnoaL-like domain
MSELDPTFVDDFACRWLEAWNRHDGRGVAQLCTEGVSFTDPAIGTVHGRAAVTEWVETALTALMTSPRTEEQFIGLNHAPGGAAAR